MDSLRQSIVRMDNFSQSIVRTAVVANLIVYCSDMYI